MVNIDYYRFNLNINHLTDAIFPMVYRHSVDSFIKQIFHNRQFGCSIV
ncbi:unnamed protein product [Acanthoscelides obtectus]|uniref:Uncharacterized protein n=1 Tax=Acanthoscelides obtectus TaxID=200917 RepID=A0A9P0KBF7_ACAOB|nr:unnamed protein product [Acanthoscelides obtectus]CAK1664228.1 hypothetical protein AOBTE_LOCUS24142 [Acanthoscelides obtectus]